MADRVRDRVAIVTGSGSGMGKAIASALAREGARVVVADINLDAANATVHSIRAGGGAAIAVQVDVSSRQQVKDMVARSVTEFGELNIIFNNAGFNKPMHFLDVTDQNWQSIMNVNAYGTLVGIQEAARVMIAQGKGGKIVNTGSIASRQGYPSFAPYCASKFAVAALTQSAARALAEHNITVNAFAPGVVATPLWEQLDADLVAIGDAAAPGEAMAAFSAGILRGRPATPDDIVGTALYLASSDSDYLTGQMIMIDGGMVLV